MSIIRLTKTFHFEMAHALKDYDGLCAHIHGHSYCLTVTVIGKPLAQAGQPKDGMVMDFKDLKKIVQEEVVEPCDHALMLKLEVRSQKLEVKNDDDAALWQKTIFVDYQPTSENMLIDFAQRITKRLPEHVRLHHLKLQETANSMAEWWAEDQ